MLEESVSSSIPSIWTSVNSWFTPTVLFVLLNVTIVTIAFISSFANQKQRQQQHRQTQDDDHHHHNHNQQQQEGLFRSPSVLQRLRSINFYAYISQEPIATHFHPTTDSDTHFAPQHQIRQNQNPEPERETQHGFQQTHFEGDGKIEEQEEEKEEEEGLRSLDEVYSQLKGRHVDRTNSDTKPASGEMPVRLPARMRKSASAKSAFAHFEEEEVVEASRPATVREGKGRAATEVDDLQVDAKADDFINRFKQQLKLQKLDSIQRYKEMITRGSGK